MERVPCFNDLIVKSPNALYPELYSYDFFIAVGFWIGIFELVSAM